MKVKDFLDTYEIIKEGYIASDYTWGFELEGICQDGELGRDDLPGYHSEEAPQGKAAELKGKLDTLINRANLISQESIAKDKEQKIIYGKIGRDGSVHPTSYANGWPFEYATGVMQFSIKGALEILKILYEELPNLGVYTNDTCGFHTHASLPYLTKEDAVWLICCISCDDEFQKELTQLNKGDVKIDFYDSTYAQKSFYDKIYNNLLNKNYSEVSRIVSGINTNDDSGKYRNIRLHPEKGTLEWRGPRNFLNDNNYDLIKEYIYKFYRVLQYYSKILNTKTWEKGGIVLTREEIDTNVSMTTSFDTNIEKHKKNSLEKVAEKIKTNSNILKGLRPQQLVDLINNYPSYVLNNNTYKVMGEIWNNMDERNLKYVFENIPMHFIIDWLTMLYEHDINYETKSWMYDKLHNSTEFNRVVANQMADFCEKYVLDFPDFTSKRRNIITYLKNSIDKVPMDFWSKILKPEYYPLISHVELPVKIQRLVKRNPYNIQYIVNPDQSVIDYVSKKVPDIDQYIPRI